MAMNWDVIIVGGGHAGCGRPLPRRAGRFGGAGDDARRPDRQDELQPGHRWSRQGHLVREIDALDGIMARAIDASGIQFRMLNRSRGPAVHGPRRRPIAGSIARLCRR